MCQDFEPELLQMSWYGPGPARPAIPPMGFGQGMPPGGMVPWGPPGGMPPRPQYQAPAPQPHFEQRPKRVSSKTFKIILQFHSLQAIPTGPAVTVFVGNITERAPDSMVCNYINIKDDCKIQFLFSQGSASFDHRRTCRELEESARSHWKAAGGWLWLAWISFYT